MDITHQVHAGIRRRQRQTLAVAVVALIDLFALSAEESRSAVSSMALWAGWLALFALIIVTGVHAVSLVISQIGMDAFQLKAFLGHASLQTTMRYVNVAELNMEEILKRSSPVDNLRL